MKLIDTAIFIGDKQIYRIYKGEVLVYAKDPIPPNDEIWYISTNELEVYPIASAFSANIISNTYENGRGIIKFDSDISNIGVLAFLQQKTLQKVMLPNSIKTIGSRSFYQCTNMVNIRISNSLMTIDDLAFMQCTSLSSISFPDTLIYINSMAFAECTSLTSITIPASVLNIGNYSFNKCSGLLSISVDSANTIYNSNDNCNAIVETNTKTLLQGCQNTIITKNISSIYNKAFESCTSLDNIIIPSSITSIGDSAFYGCSQMSYIICESENPATIGNLSFDDTNNCPIYVPNDGYDTYISDWSTYLARIVAANNIILYESTDNKIVTPSNIDFGTTLINNIYKGIGALIFLGNVTLVGAQAFINCKMLSKMILPLTVTAINYSAFNGCTGLITVSIPHTTSTLGKNVFANCTSLTTITLPEIIVKMPDHTFYKCTSLQTYNIANIVNTLGNSMFQLAGLINITIPASVNNIGDYCFYGCQNLTSITCLSNTPAVIGEQSFTNIGKCIIYVPADSLDIYKEQWQDYAEIIQPSK